MEPYVGLFLKVANFRSFQLEMRLVRLMLLLTGIWTLAWTPYALVMALAQIPSLQDYLSPIADAVPALACKASAAINPFIYGLQ